MAAQPVARPPLLPGGIKTFLCGPQGVGKSHSVKTLLDKRLGLKVAAVATEPSALDVWGKLGLLNDERFYWTYLPPYTADWSTLLDVGRKINLLGNESLQKMKGISEDKFKQFLSLLELFNNFTDWRGRRIGDISQLGTDWAMVVDGLTGMNKMARTLAVGAKAALTQPDWGVSMDNLQRVIDTLAMSLRCHLVITAHVEYASDEVTGQGALRMMISTLGRRLGPVIGVNFSEIILARREGTSYFWSTSDSRMDLRSSYLDLGDKHQPDFAPLIEAWKKRQPSTEGEKQHAL